eukprot:TRINITY_DN40702_c0_g1_i1.p1 TRINITY_DN40702_c0_g1~~TRINITY_DN40702_c0_g1_i1.p1  ORF type:complete len:182 (-),score=13.32 TRINITY_DN40702_c0_g1_i1:233-730(-)
MVFTAAVRAGLPIEEWMPQWHRALRELKMSNGVVYQEGGGIEVAGAAEAVNSMLLQSHRGYLELFPAWNHSQPASFETLRAKGAHLVSASWDSTAQAVASPFLLKSEVGSKVWIKMPLGWPHGAAIVQRRRDGGHVDLQWQGTLFGFITGVNETYTIGVRSQAIA